MKRTNIHNLISKLPAILVILALGEIMIKASMVFLRGLFSE